jgi:hypothetical protein
MGTPTNKPQTAGVFRRGKALGLAVCWFLVGCSSSSTSTHVIEDAEGEAPTGWDEPGKASGAPGVDTNGPFGTAEGSSGGANSEGITPTSSTPNEEPSKQSTAGKPPSRGTVDIVHPLCWDVDSASQCVPDDTTPSLTSPTLCKPGAACVVSVGDGFRMTTCTNVLAGIGGTDYPCQSQRDCVAGFACVGSPGRCRPYCCGHTCEDSTDYCGIDQTPPSASGTSFDVPVCLPRKPCTLLGTDCAANETCILADQSGGTTCAPVGPATAGEECETRHCATGLACLGMMGFRQCRTLCDTRVPDTCGPSRRCRTGAPLGSSRNVGICD